MANLNTGPYRNFRDGGVIKLTDVEATTTYDDLEGIEENSVGFTPGLHQRFFDQDHGQLRADVRRGAEQPTTLSITIKTSATAFAAGGPLALLQDDIKATDDGYVRKWTVLWEQGDVHGDATGETITFSDCVVTGLQHSAGEEYDTLQVEFTSPHPTPTLGTYT